MTRPRKSGDMSDMVHRIKTLNGQPFDPSPVPREMISNPAIPAPVKKDG